MIRKLHFLLHLCSLFFIGFPSVVLSSFTPSFLKYAHLNLYCNIAKADSEISLIYRSFRDFISSLLDIIDDQNLSSNFLSSRYDVDKDYLKETINFYLNILSINWTDRIIDDFKNLHTLVSGMRNNFENLFLDKSVDLSSSQSSCFSNNSQIIKDDSLLQSNEVIESIYKARKLLKTLVSYSSDIDLLISEFSNNILNSAYDSEYLKKFLNINLNDDKAFEAISSYITYLNPYWLNAIKLNVTKVLPIIYNISNITTNLEIYLQGGKIDEDKFFSELLKYDDNYILMDNDPRYEGNMIFRSADDVIYDRDQEDYKISFDLLKKYKLIEAKQSFLSFTDHYPKSRYMINVYYWLGEIEYQLKQYEESYKYYRHCYEISTAEDSKHLLSLVKITLALSKMKVNNHNESCKFLFRANDILDNENDPTKYIEKLISEKIVELKCEHYFK